MSLENIPGQPRTKRFLKQLVKTGRVPHALLFSGMAGIGKAALAREFAKLLNCLQPVELDSCDSCPPCRKADSGHHPDIVTVQADGAFIKVDQVRELQDRLRLPPFESKWRVIIMLEAQKMREEAANALLKLLEEPPERNIFILTVVEARMLLETIVSRCCQIRFQPLDDAAVEEQVARDFGLHARDARQLARLSEGSLYRARWLAEAGRLERWRQIARDLQGLGRIRMLDFFPQMQQWVQKSEDLEQDLECIKLWVRDLILLGSLDDYRPVFDIDEATRNRIANVRSEVLFRIHEEIEQAMARLRQNANKQLMLEGICLAIKDSLYGESRWHSLS